MLLDLLVENKETLEIDDFMLDPKTNALLQVISSSKLILISKIPLNNYPFLDQNFTWTLVHKTVN